MRVGIIGAGPAGLTAAYRLIQAGANVTVFEASPHLGGMSRSIDLWGQRVDLGPHRFFSKNRQVNALWHEVIGREYRTVDRQTRIYYGKRFFDYPLRAQNVIRNLGPLTVVRCMTSWAAARMSSKQSHDRGETFETWVISRFGRRLYEIFFRSYTEKLWGIPCHELDADFAAQRIKGFSFGSAITSALGIGSSKHKTLVDAFDFPQHGSGAVYEKMAAFIEASGGDIHLSTPIERVETHNQRVTGLRLENGHSLPFDHVISTMPLTLMASRLPDVPAAVAKALGTLHYRNTIIIYLNVESTQIFTDQWVYIHEPDVAAGRVTNFRNWVPELYGDRTSSILAVEFWCNEEDELWKKTDEVLIRQAETELRYIKLIGTATVSAGHVQRVPRSYPVYARGYRETLQTVVDFLKTYDNLSPIGRYGSFKYNNQDHSIFMGLLAAENIAGGKQHDLWSVNTDYDDYQENAVRNAIA